MRSTAQVLPGNRIIAPEIVVDGEFSGADLHRGGVTRSITLTVSSWSSRTLVCNQLELVRLVRQLLARLFVRDGSPAESLALLDDLGHLALELSKIIRGERLCDVEVVIEAVGDRRPDAQFRVGMERLHRLSRNMGGGVPEDV